MQKYVVVALAALIASPVFGAVSKEDRAGPAANPVDALYPEIAVSDEGWRGLLPVILLRTEDIADQPERPQPPAKRSERNGPRGT